MRAVYEPTGRAKEYADLAVNVATGCTHGCRYCYGPAIRRCTPAQWGENVRPRPGILEAIQADADRLAGCARRVLFCFMTDPFSTPEIAGVTMNGVAHLAARCVRSTVLTKAGMAAVPHFEAMRKAECWFGQTISFLRDDLRREWEPGASAISDRIDAARLAVAAGLVTWVSVEPVIDADEALAVMRELRTTVHHWKVGKLNHRPDVEARTNWRRFLAEAREALAGCEVYWKRDLLAHA